MAKSKNFNFITLSNGGKAIFNWTTFHDAVDNAKSKRFRGNRTETFRAIAKELYPDCKNDVIEDMVGTIKNWYFGYNGPSLNEEEIHKIEQLLDCDHGSFLKHESQDTFTETEENNMDEAKANVQSAELNNLSIVLEQLTDTLKAVNSTKPLSTDAQANRNNEYVTLLSGSRMLKNALMSVRQKEVAHKLYGLFTDAIWEYCKVDYDIYNCKLYDELIDKFAYPEDEEKKKWDFTSERFQQFKERLRNLPRRISLEIAVEKSSLYLPKELRYKLSGLLDELYGDRDDFLQEPGGSWQEDWVCRLFLGAKAKQLEEHLNGWLSQEYDADDVIDGAYYFFDWEVIDLEIKLNDIFSNYLCE